eukprot:m.229351 g.229351  ORF g.229351 m.229351 type:complete len:145 (-) comp26439_c0_seq2:215-649(-)
MKRRDGKVVQDCDVYIGRQNHLGGWNLPQSPFHNPFSAKFSSSRDARIAKFREYILTQPALLSQLPTLHGKVLGCWCAPLPCHGDVLIELLYERHPELLSDSSSSPSEPHVSSQSPTPTPSPAAPVVPSQSAIPNTSGKALVQR